jgi:hypothetical protein
VKRSTKIMVVGVVLLVIVILNMDFIDGYTYLVNDDEIMNTLSEEDVLIEYPYIELQKRVVKSSIEVMEGKDIFRDTSKSYTFFVRPFTAWKHPKEDIPLEDNWKVFGYVTMDGQVFYVYSLRGDQVWL